MGQITTIVKIKSKLNLTWPQKIKKRLNYGKYLRSNEISRLLMTILVLKFIDWFKRLNLKTYKDNITINITVYIQR